MWAAPHPRGAGVVPASKPDKTCPMNIESALGVLALLRSARTAGDRPCPCRVRWTLRRYCYPAIRCGGIVIGNPARNQAVITSHPLLCPDTMARCPRGAWGPRRPAAGDRGWIGIRGGGISGGALRGRRRGACPVCGLSSVRAGARACVRRVVWRGGGRTAACRPLTTVTPDRGHSTYKYTRLRTTHLSVQR
jgi:hypothetical protein